jgi:hypothetical protein
MDRISTKMEGLAVTVTITSISCMHRSLFHPLATLTHRIWAGTETKETENKTNSTRIGTNLNWNWLRKLTRKSYLRSQCSDPFFCNTELHLNARFLIQYRLQVSKSSAMEDAHSTSLKLSILRCTNQWVCKHNCDMFGARNEPKRLNDVKNASCFEVQRWVLVARNKTIFPDRKAYKICRVVTKLLSMPKLNSSIWSKPDQAVSVYRKKSPS